VTARLISALLLAAKALAADVSLSARHQYVELESDINVYGPRHRDGKF
jgi:hypothetical protein